MNYYENIKNEFINNEINRKVKSYSINKSDLTTYYNVGKMLFDAGKHYGEGILKDYSNRLTNELGKGYNISNLKRFRQFYLLLRKGATLSHQLTWSHYIELIPLDDINIINYYVKQISILNLSVRELRRSIKAKEYERLPEETKNNLIINKCDHLNDFVKNPIFIKNNFKIENISEKILQKLIIENITSFMNELGNGFSFVDNEYKIKLGDNYNYIDLLLFNYEYNCFCSR